MFITAGTFGYALLGTLLNYFNEISFNLPFAGNDASDSDVLSNFSTLLSLGLGRPPS